MWRSDLVCLLAALSCVAPVVAAPHAQQPEPHLSALVSSGQVHVDFGTAAPLVNGLDVGSLEVMPTVVTWDVDLRSDVRSWRSRSIQKTTLQVIVRPLSERGRCEATRQLNGRWIEPRQAVECAVAYGMISSFNMPLFALPDLEPGGYEVTVRATIDAMGRASVKTPVLARTRVIR
jgi:hypothetical protein